MNSEQQVKSNLQGRVGWNAWENKSLNKNSHWKIVCWKFLEHGFHTVKLEIFLQVISVQRTLWMDKQPFLYVAQNTTWQPGQFLNTHGIYTWLETAAVLLNLFKLHNRNEFNYCFNSKTDKTDLWCKLKRNTCPIFALSSFFQ